MNHTENFETNYTCEVLGFYDQSYNVVSENEASTVFIGFENWLEKLSSETVWSPDNYTTD